MPKLSDKYHKIMSVFKRRMDGDKKLIEGDWVNDEIAFLKDNDWIFTEKVDGTNIRVSWDGNESVYRGRSDEAQIPTPLIYALDQCFKTFQARQRLTAVFGSEVEESITLYGEGYGKGIQAAGRDYCADGVRFVLFDVKIGGYYLERHNVEDIAKKLELACVPIIGHGTLNEAIEIVRKGFKSNWGDFIAEGIVARPRVEMFSRKGERMITKVKHRDFT